MVSIIFDRMHAGATFARERCGIKVTSVNDRRVASLDRPLHSPDNAPPGSGFAANGPTLPFL